MPLMMSRSALLQSQKQKQNCRVQIHVKMDKKDEHIPGVSRRAD